jgi:hypothetical protein
MPLALLSGIPSLGTDSMAQDRGVFDRGIFNQNQDVFGRDQDRYGLPRDAEMLKADDTECQGALLASGLQGASDVQSVGRGEQRVFQVEYQNVPWACLSPKTARSGTMECPNGTQYVRITHQADVAKFECFGRRR